MSTFTYTCTNPKCIIHEKTFEVKQSMKDDALVSCTRCKKDTLKKVITSSGGFRIGGLGVHKPTAHWGS